LQNAGGIPIQLLINLVLCNSKEKVKRNQWYQGIWRRGQLHTI